MASNHIAIFRGSNRTAHKKDSEQSEQHKSSTASNPTVQSADEFSQLSVISVSSGGSSNLKNAVRPALTVKPTFTSLGKLICDNDLKPYLGANMAQEEVLASLERSWHDISQNFATVIDHLGQCCKSVTEASNHYLQRLVESVELSCDKAEAQSRALYHLMTKCDELTTKLSAAASFREEVRTLRKSVDTLEALYKASHMMITSS